MTFESEFGQVKHTEELSGLPRVGRREFNHYPQRYIKEGRFVLTNWGDDEMLFEITCLDKDVHNRSKDRKLKNVLRNIAHDILRAIEEDEYGESSEA